MKMFILFPQLGSMWNKLITRVSNLQYGISEDNQSSEIFGIIIIQTLMQSFMFWTQLILKDFKSLKKLFIVWSTVKI